MKKKAKRLISALLAATVVLGVGVGATGCGKSKKEESGLYVRRDGKKYDSSKTQINVYLYKAGYGEDWIYDYEEAFEKAYANVSLEEGKQGVQVWHAGDMSSWTTTNMNQSPYDIFFFENENYYNFLDGTLEDLTDIVKTTLPGESRTIEDKLTDQQQNYFAVKQNGDTTGKYYALPHYYGTYGIVYNVDLFDKMGYYFDENGEIIGEDNTTAVKSLGPDGKTGYDEKTNIDYSLDDGLPATYDQFYELCAYIKTVTGQTPLCWPGKYYEHHLLNLYDNLVAGYEGIDQMMLNYGFNEGVETPVKATDLIEVDGNGNVTELPETEITTANGYELARQAGKYYAYEFLSEIMKQSNGWYNKKAYTISYTHTDNQRDYLKYGTRLSKEKKTTAMLVDGPWWQTEAKAAFENMVKNGGNEYSANSRKFGWMPLPHADESKVGEKPVYSDYLKTFVCMKSGLGTRKRAAEEFIKFISTDEQLVAFTKSTGTLRGYKYDIEPSDMTDMSYFTKSVINYVKGADVIYKFSGGKFYNANNDKLKYDIVYQTTISGSVYKNPAKVIREKKTSAATWFNEYYKSLRGNLNWK